MTATAGFLSPVAVQTACDLFDRGPQMDAVKQTILAGTRRPIVLLGPRLMGKTSLLNVIAEWAGKRESHAVVRLANATTQAGFMAEILHGIQVQTTPGRPANVTSTGMSSTTGFVTAIRELTSHRPNTTFLLCLDEFDSIIGRCSPKDAQEILSLILHITEHGRLPVQFLLTMCRIPEPIVLSHESPVINQATIVELTSWPRSEARQYADWIAVGKARLGEEAHQKLFALTGGHPYFTKAVLRSVLRSVRQDRATDVAEETSSADRRIASLIDRHAASVSRSREVQIAFASIRRAHLNERTEAAVNRIARSAGGLTVAELEAVGVTPEKLDEMLGAGLVRSDGLRVLLRLGLWRHCVTRHDNASGPTGRQRLNKLLKKTLTPKVSSRVAAIVAIVGLLGLAGVIELALVDQHRIVVCGTPSGTAMINVVHPSRISQRDEQRIELSVVNQQTGGETLSGRLVVRLGNEPGSVLLLGDNGIEFRDLRVGEQRALTIDFVPREVGSKLPIVIETGFDAASCGTHEFAVPVAPGAYLKLVQSGALGLVLVPILPIVLERLVGLTSRRGSSPDELEASSK